MMVITEIKKDWWTLLSDDGIRPLRWYGRSKDEVRWKFRAWVREHDMSLIRRVPAHQTLRLEEDE